MTFNTCWIPSDATIAEVIQMINMNLSGINHCLQDLEDKLDSSIQGHQHTDYITREDISDLHAHLKYFCNDLLRQEGYILGRLPDSPMEPQV
jgi:hypothetical protein